MPVIYNFLPSFFFLEKKTAWGPPKAPQKYIPDFLGSVMHFGMVSKQPLKKESWQGNVIYRKFKWYLFFFVSLHFL